MPDPFEPEKRSEIMRRVRSRDTAPERAIRSGLHRLGFRYRLYRKDLPGTPDLVFSSRKTAVFIHGCFWHGHSCKRGNRLPSTNAEYWRIKIARNKARDEKTIVQLEALGWRVIVLWECEMKNIQTAVWLLADMLNNSAAFTPNIC